MKCNNCGQEIDANETFCHNCGAYVPELLKHQPTDNKEKDTIDTHNDEATDSHYNSENDNNDGMFSNVGKKIETYAKVCMFICTAIAIIIILSSIITATNMYYGGGGVVIVALFSGVIIIIAGYIGSLMIFGFGKLIENVEEIKNILNNKK